MFESDITPLGILIWRVPNNPVEGWKLHPIHAGEIASSVVSISDFNGELKSFSASCESEDALWDELLSQKLPELQGDFGSNKALHIARINDAIAHIRTSGMRKVVIARREDLVIELELRNTFRTLVSAYPNATVYTLWLNGKLWMGATPETLLTSQGSMVKTMALAGTRKLTGPSFSEKEEDEQLAVTESIESSLIELGAQEVVLDGPKSVQAGPVQHLLTSIEADLPNMVSALTCAKALHPTPAVCGMPKQEAFDLIQKLEDFDRELYAGFIGLETKNKSQFYVNLRCMQIGHNKVALYAGGGITSRSNPEMEWEETVVKMDTLKNIIIKETSSDAIHG